MFREVGLYSRGAHIKDFTVYQSSIEVEQYLQQRYLKNIKQPDQMNKIEIPLPYYPAYKHPHAHLLISRRYLSISDDAIDVWNYRNTVDLSQITVAQARVFID